MIRFYFNALIFMLLSSQLMAQNISVEDYLIPESRYKNLLGSLQGNYGNSKSGFSWSEGESQSGIYRLSLKNVFGYNSENESYVINTNCDGAYNYNSSSTNFKDNSSPKLRKDKRTYEETNLNFSGQYSSYLTPDKIYFYSSASLSGSYNLSNDKTDTNNVLAQLSFHKNRTISGSFGSGIGLGKMREASSVFAVVRIIEKLKEDGYLTRELRKEEILDIVNIYARRIEYLSSYERPTKYFLDDLLQKLETIGVLKDKRASAYEIARVEEVFQEYIFRRMVGWTIQGGIEISRNQSEVSNNQQYYYPWNVVKSEQNSIVINAKYGHPFSLSLHWYNEATLSFPVYGKQNRVNQFLQSILYYQVGEKISNELNVSYQNNNQYQTSSHISDSFNFNNYLSIGNTLRYFVENNINFSFGINYNDWMVINESNSSSNRNTSSGININFGLNYRFF